MNTQHASEPDRSAVKPRFRARPWQMLETPCEVETWIAEHNRSMQENMRTTENGCGICLSLIEGGEIFLQTGTDGAVILDVTPEADWVAPLICAATRTQAPASSIWILPDDKLIELILGLSSLIASSILVVGHNFGKKIAYSR